MRAEWLAGKRGNDSRPSRAFYSSLDLPIRTDPETSHPILNEPACYETRLDSHDLVYSHALFAKAVRGTEPRFLQRLEVSHSSARSFPS